MNSPSSRRRRVPLRTAAALAILLSTAACSASRGEAAPANIACASGSVKAQGSSAQTNAVNAWIKNYQVSCPDATIAYDSAGSGAGVRAFADGTGDFAGSDSALTAETLPGVTARCGGPVVHLPMVVGPIALAFNVAGVSSLLLTPAVIAQIFRGTITTWNDKAIGALNPGVLLPATPIRTVHRSDSSGTTDNFTKFLAATAGADWQFGSDANWPAPGGSAQKGSNRVVAAIERTDGAIGYVESSYASFHNLPTARVRNAAGQYPALTDAAAAEMVAGARVTGAGGDLQLAIDYRNATPGAYPIVLVTYEILCRAHTSALAKSFLTYASSPAGQQAATDLGYAPLPEGLRTKVAAAVAAL
ncbi:phosphate ABC transporter substrate-binding protein PstS [Actinoplanes sp. TBRC 11911]|uniref:phosphate ABC transporter substrate-binding protein PstS n=1 Tax=Actinoplanes sp. TBRC 11911 TaxID=2729386 RepID=UPI00145F9713|nr:phosphate ABC transporter substrate-binding protein PstS [Actinoplanes sp. TBRC 11911]NMO51724.1 phosphate ABC transporter substrate-binding protein PstS [Actinoplanes sp. TBRC 11911]